MASLLGMKKKQDTVKTRKAIAKPTTGPLFMSEPYVSSVLLTGDVRRIVQQPKFMDNHEWLASFMSEFCTPRECPSMTAGECFEYLWTDQDRKAQRVSASQYIDYVMTWLNAQLYDEAMFPTRNGQPFPKDSVAAIKVAFKRMFRVLAHIYHSHFERIIALQLEAHLNTLFVHFICFALEHDLIERKELAPMASLINEYVAKKLLGPDMVIKA